MMLRLIGEEYYERALRWAYNIFSRFYDEFTLRLPRYSEIYTLMLRLASPSSEDEVLDVACGTGLISIPMVDKASDVIGLDISLGQLRRMKLKGKTLKIRPHLVLGDAKNLPFRESSFSMTICSGALSEIPRKDRS